MKNILILISLYFFTASCRKEAIAIDRSENGIVVSRSYNWKIPLFEGGPSTFNSYFHAPIYYNGNIAIPTTKNGNRYMTMINSTNGETIWQWADLYQPDTEAIDISYYYQNNNLLTYQTGDRSYCINLDSGTTAWKFRRDDAFDVRINSVDNDYITYGELVNSSGNVEQIAYKGDITTGTLPPFLQANLSQSYVSAIGVGGIIYVNQVPSNPDLLLVTYAEPLPNWEVNSFFALYNKNTDDWLWDRKLLATPTVNTSVFTPPQFYDDMAIANVGKNLVCHNIVTGEQIWTRAFAQDFMFSGFIIAEDKIIANCEDGYTYGIAPADGSILWQTRSSGTSGRMSYLNGVVYFVGGASGALHAIDIASGRMLWKIENENIGDSGSFQTNAVYVFPASGSTPAHVVALTYDYAYSFDAVR